MRRLIAFAVAISIGAAIALAAMPWIVRNAHDDASRLCVVLDACRSGASPRIVVLGNSVSMFAIDARALSEALPSKPLAWNLGSPAQTLTEAFLLMQELPRSVETVVQIVTPTQLEHQYPIDPGRYDALVICGYRPEGETRAAVERAFGGEAASALDIGRLAARAHGRRHVRASIEGLARDVLQRDPERARLTHDLFFPATHQSRGGWLPEQLFANLDPGDRRVRNPRQDAILAATVSASRRARRRHVVVLAPTHPILRAASEEMGCPPRLECLDLRALLRAEEFRDPTHPTFAGARKTTAAIAWILGRPLAMQ